MFAKCRYHRKLLARWYGSSGNWEKSRLEMVFDASVARATIKVIVLEKELAIADRESFRFVVVALSMFFARCWAPWYTAPM